MNSPGLSIHLFSYGSLQSSEVQLNTFGRLLEGEAAILPGFIPGLVPIADEALIARTGNTHHKNIIYTGNPADSIRGMVFIIYSYELEQVDKYEEEANYKRILVELQSGKPAWVYVSAKEAAL